METTSDLPITTTSDPKALKLAVSIALLRSLKEKQQKQNQEQGQQQQQSSNKAPSAATSDPKALKLAVAIALLRSQNEQQKKRKKEQDQEEPKSSDQAHRWKTKAKERKMELFRLRKEIEQLEDGGGEREKQHDLFSRIVSCSCHFFDERGEIGAKRLRLGVVGDGEGGGRSEGWIDDVLRRRFLRHVRWNERRKNSTVSSVEHRRCVLGNNEDEIEKLSTSADFLVELSGVMSQDNNNKTLAALSHQAVDFVIASVKNLLSHAKDYELVEEIITDLIARLAKRICSPSEQDESSVFEPDADSHVQHLIRMLGRYSYIGQRIMLSISQRICVLAENLLLVDPFDDSFPDMNDWMFMMIQLIELLISDNMQTWTEEFDSRLFEEWLRSVLHAHKSLELLECRNGLYILYMERVTGELVKWLRPLSREGKLSLDILSSFLR